VERGRTMGRDEPASTHVTATAVRAAATTTRMAAATATVLGKRRNRAYEQHHYQSYVLLHVRLQKDPRYLVHDRGARPSALRGRPSPALRGLNHLSTPNDSKGNQGATPPLSATVTVSSEFSAATRQMRRHAALPLHIGTRL
jgi:hypothetical protein